LPQNQNNQNAVLSHPHHPLRQPWNCPSLKKQQLASAEGALHMQDIISEIILHYFKFFYIFYYFLLVFFFIPLLVWKPRVSESESAGLQ